MKIDGNRVAQDTQATEHARRAGKDTGTRRAGDSIPAASGDRVEVSQDAALLAAALKAANEAPAIRMDRVEQVREKLAAGKVGNDPQTLADAMIDDLLK